MYKINKKCKKCGAGIDVKSEFDLCYSCYEKYKSEKFMKYGKKKCSKCGTMITGDKKFCYTCYLKEIKRLKIKNW